MIRTHKEKIFIYSVFILLGAMALTFLGTIIPTYIRNQTIASTEYYSVVNVGIDREIYEPCESVLVTVARNSLLDLSINSLRELNLIKADGLEEVYSSETKRVAQEGSFVISSQYILPCTKEDGSALDEGDYFWEVEIEYTVEGKAKSTSFRTPTFEIKNIQ